MKNSSPRLARIAAALAALVVSTQLGPQVQASPVQGEPNIVHRPVIGPEPASRVLVTEPQPGERLDASAFGPTWIETMDAVLQREAERTEPYLDGKARNGAHGSWETPSRRWSGSPHSGLHYAAAKWGDTRMGIGFGRPVELRGVWVAGYMDHTAWTPGLRAVGYLDGREVGTTAWFADIGESPAWFPIGLEGVDRVVFEALPRHGGAGYYGIDDLTYAVGGETVVVDFEDAGYRAALTGSGYAGLTWETGTGDFDQEAVQVQAPPQAPPGWSPAELEESELGGGLQAAAGAGTLPVFVRRWAGPRQNEPGAFSVPPDTHGAIGTSHFVAVVNQHISVYDRNTQARLLSSSLQSFFGNGGSAGDPRVLFDHQAGRWVVIASNFSDRVRFAYSLTDDAMGAWLKTSIILSQGSNTGDWPDYPTVGYDADGIYIAAYMVGSIGFSIFAVDKAPLLQVTPSVGTVTAWRGLPYEDAVQPAVTFGNPGSEYLVSRTNLNTQRIRRIDGPLSSPTLVEVGFVATLNGNSPPSAPALGSSLNLDTLEGRPMNAVYRNGALWTVNCVNKGGRAAVNWYKFDPVNATVFDQGTVRDPVMSFFMPSITVNANDDVLIAFTASSPSMFAGCWYTGRSSGDPLGEMADPAEYKNGNAAYNQGSSGGVYRWGDYSMSTIDPLDDIGLWTIQEHTNNTGLWATNIGEFDPGAFVCGLATNYCTAGTSASGCQAILSAIGTPSASATSGFTLVASDVEGLKDGLFFYAANGRQANSWGSGTSYQCVVPPVLRAGLQTGSGTNGACDGGFAQDLNALWSSSPPKNPGAGALVQAQAWYRDPQNTSNQTTSLSDALEFSICP